MLAAIGLGLVVGFMRCALIGKTEIQYPGLVEATLELMVKADAVKKPPDAQYHSLHATLHRDNPRLGKLVVEAFHFLLYNGYIAPFPNPPNIPRSNAFFVTDRGKDWATGYEPPPEDAVQFLTTLKSMVPNIDTVIEQYVQEALVVYERKAYFAAAVMIGAAAEKAVYLLAEALEKATHDQLLKGRLRNAIQARSLPALFKTISDALRAAKKKIPYQVSEGVEEHLVSFFESIRVQRNDAVHPTAATVSPDKARLSIAAFPCACKKVFELVEWLRLNRL